MSYQALHLEPGEHVIFQVRKHWIVFAVRGLALLFAGLLPLIIFRGFKVFLPDFAVNIDVHGNGSALFLFFFSIWLLILWLSFFVDWTKYYLDVWYVTEKRIIAIEQKKIFDREISNLRFEKIQDVTIEVQGFLPTLLKFGTIKVQTAGEDSTEFFMTTVRHPEDIRRVIFSQQNKIGDASRSVV
jgi:hypothetical protein